LSWFHFTLFTCIFSSNLYILLYIKFEEKIQVNNVKWNQDNSDQFILQVDNELIPYIFIHQSIDGPFVTHVKNYKSLRCAFESDE
jgi:hypothetical protein